MTVRTDVKGRVVGQLETLLVEAVKDQLGKPPLCCPVGPLLDAPDVLLQCLAHSIMITAATFHITKVDKDNLCSTIVVVSRDVLFAGPSLQRRNGVLQIGNPACCGSGASSRLGWFLGLLQLPKSRW